MVSEIMCSRCKGTGLVRPSQDLIDAAVIAVADRTTSDAETMRGTLLSVKQWLEGDTYMTALSIYETVVGALRLEPQVIDASAINLEMPDHE